MDVLRQDVQHALRSLRRQSGTAAIVVLTLAVGIGLITALFTLIHSTLLRPLPYHEPDRLVMIWTSIPTRGVTEATSAFANVEDWRTRTRVFEDIATLDQTTLTLTGGQWAERAGAVRSSANLFSLLGVAPALGRSFSAAEERAGTPVAVLSHDFWRSRFGGSTEAVGSTIEISGRRFEVVGVMPEGFVFPEPGTQFWLPQTLFTDWEATSAQRGTGAFRVVARLRGGASLEHARSEMSEIAARLEQEHPGANAGLGASVVPLHEQIAGGSFRMALWTLFGAVALVLLLACANAAQMVLARGLDRDREFAVRQALGATRRRLIRQTMTENVVLGLTAGVAALLLAYAGIRLLISLAPSTLPRLDEVGIGAAVLIFAGAVSLAAGVLVGVLPAVNSVRMDLFASLREGRGERGGTRVQRMRSILIALQFALAVVLVSGANLLVRSLLEARGVDAGFAVDDVVIANLSVEEASRRVPFYQRALLEVQAIPGVSAAGLIEDLLISGAPGRAVAIEGAGTAEASFESIRADAIAGDFFRTVGVSLRHGRDFSAADHAEAAPVAIINEIMARRFWPGMSPVGQRFRFGGQESPGPWIEVVGVVGDMRRQGPEREPISQVFRPFVQEPSRNMNLLVRSTLPASAITATIRTTLAAIDNSVPLYHVTTAEQAMGRYLLQRGFEALLLSVFSAVAMLLAAIGIYGLIHYSVIRRTHELAVRMALGASSQRLKLLMLRHTLGLTLPGLVAGTLAALWLSHSISALLFGVAPATLTNILTPAAVLLATALAAAWIPARRAARVDPISVLRSG
jgi:predicted permease